MAWKKAPAELIARFDAVLPRDQRVERRTMFGYPCAFVNGNMFCGLHEDRLIVRLPEAGRCRLVEAGDASPFEPWPGRRMKEYVVVPRPLVNPDLPRLLGAGLAYAAGLPAKAKRKPASSSRKKRAR